MPLTKEPYILEFNVGREEFRVFSLPKFIVEDIRYPGCGQLIEVDGHLAVVGKKVDMECQQNNNTSMKMCILHVDQDQDRKMKKTHDPTCMGKVPCSTSIDCCCYYWMEETFLTPPPFDWDPRHPYAILAIPDTDLFIIRSFENGRFCFYYYNWRKKYFSAKSEIVGMTSFFQDTAQLVTSHCVLRTYRESLL
ncbi:hypothetical protein MKW94_021241, partial [Papaver nudicaule]|nr:hypothetical protein [Papaver nudicaule]